MHFNCLDFLGQFVLLVRLLTKQVFNTACGVFKKFMENAYYKQFCMVFKIFFAAKFRNSFP